MASIVFLMLIAWASYATWSAIDRVVNRKERKIK